MGCEMNTNTKRHKIGDIVLYQGKDGANIDLEGKIETEKGIVYVKLWKKHSDSVTGGYYFQGKVEKVVKE